MHNRDKRVEPNFFFPHDFRVFNEGTFEDYFSNFSIVSVSFSRHIYLLFCVDVTEEITLLVINSMCYYSSKLDTLNLIAFVITIFVT